MNINKIPQTVNARYSIIYEIQDFSLPDLYIKGFLFINESLANRLYNTVIFLVFLGSKSS